jgi:hypothetical protein
MGVSTDCRLAEDLLRRKELRAKRAAEIAATIAQRAAKEQAGPAWGRQKQAVPNR